MEIKICQTCNKEFKGYKSANRKYCSRRCFERRREEIKCLGCGVDFYIAGEPNMKYHNRKCWIKNNKFKGTFKPKHKHNLGRKHTKETREKISLQHRRNRAKWVKNWIQFPNFNSKGCNKILEYGTKEGYKFQTAVNGGEFYIKGLGYWVDGYDKEKNVVIEYMEPFHKTPKHRKKDIKRKQRIIEHLNCKFIELWE